MPMDLKTLLYALLAGILPSLIWLWFWLREDREHPEPRFLIFLTFLGGMVAVAFAVFVEKWISGFVTDTNMKYTLWAAAEEILKFAAAGAVALTTNYYDEPIDAMIYCITCALGFSALENALFVSNTLAGGDLIRSVVTENMRFIGASLVHVVSSAFVGFMLGRAFFKGPGNRLVGTLIGLLGAVALHASFNIAIVNGGPVETLRIFAWVWGAVVILIVLFEEIKAVRARQL